MSWPSTGRAASARTGTRHWKRSACFMGAYGSTSPHPRPRERERGGRPFYRSLLFVVAPGAERVDTLTPQDAHLHPLLANPADQLLPQVLLQHPSRNRSDEQRADESDHNKCLATLRTHWGQRSLWVRPHGVRPILL